MRYYKLLILQASIKVENSRYKPLYQQIAGLSQMGRAIIVHLSMSDQRPTNQHIHVYRQYRYGTIDA